MESLAQELARIKTEKEDHLKSLNLNPEETDLASFLYEKMCHSNHTEGCVMKRCVIVIIPMDEVFK